MVARLRQLVGHTESDIAADAVRAAISLDVSSGIPQVPDRLAALWRAGTELARRAVVFTAERLGPAAATVTLVEELEADLCAPRDGNCANTAEAWRCVSALGPAAFTQHIVEQAFSDVCGDPQPSAIEAVAQMAASTPEHCDRVVNLLGHAKAAVRRVAATVLRDVAFSALPPAAFPRLLEMLRDCDESVRVAAVEAVNSLYYGHMPEVRERIEAMLADSDVRLQRTAAQLVGRLGVAVVTPAITERFITLLEHTDTAVLATVLEAVGALGPRGVSPQILDQFARLLEHESSAIRKQTLQLLPELGVAAITPASVDGVLRLLHRASDPVHLDAISTVGSVCATAVAAMAAPARAAESLQNTSNATRRNEAHRQNAGAIRPGVEAMLAALTKLLDNKAEAVRSHARIAIQNVCLRRGPGTSDLIAAMLQTGRRNAQMAGCDIMRLVGSVKPTTELATALGKLCRHKDDYLRWSAIRALSGLHDGYRLFANWRGAWTAVSVPVLSDTQWAATPR